MSSLDNEAGAHLGANEQISNTDGMQMRRTTRENSIIKSVRYQAAMKGGVLGRKQSNRKSVKGGTSGNKAQLHGTVSANTEAGGTQSPEVIAAEGQTNNDETMGDDDFAQLDHTSQQSLHTTPLTQSSNVSHQSSSLHTPRMSVKRTNFVRQEASNDGQSSDDEFRLPNNKRKKSNKETPKAAALRGKMTTLKNLVGTLDDGENKENTLAEEEYEIIGDDADEPDEASNNGFAQNSMAAFMAQMKRMESKQDYLIRKVQSTDQKVNGLAAVFIDVADNYVIPLVMRQHAKQGAFDGRKKVVSKEQWDRGFVVDHPVDIDELIQPISNFNPKQVFFEKISQLQKIWPSPMVGNMDFSNEVQIELRECMGRIDEPGKMGLAAAQFCWKLSDLKLECHLPMFYEHPENAPTKPETKKQKIISSVEQSFFGNVLEYMGGHAFARQVDGDPRDRLCSFLNTCRDRVQSRLRSEDLGSIKWYLTSSQSTFVAVFDRPDVKEEVRRVKEEMENARKAAQRATKIRQLEKAQRELLEMDGEVGASSSGTPEAS